MLFHENQNFRLLSLQGRFQGCKCNGLRYGWHPPRPLKCCVCSQAFSVDHSLTCPCRGFPTLRHIILWTVLLNVYREYVTMFIGVEPNLNSFYQERHNTIEKRPTELKEPTYIDVIADSFWGRRKHALFDGRVFQYWKPPIATCYRAQKNA